MVPNMSLQAAAPSKSSSIIIEIIVLAFLLVFLMASPSGFSSWGLALHVLIAILLSIMTEEDAHKQTVDLRFLSILAIFMAFGSFGRIGDFIKCIFIGLCFFRFLLVTMSIYLSCRSASVAVLSDVWRGDGSSEEERRDQPAGYLPIFMIVFVLYLGFGENLAPAIFSEAIFVVDTVSNIADFYPALPFISIFCWFLSEIILFWLVYSKKKQILWAFGGGDVLFLGLFAGYLGLAPLFALFFLSLIARTVFSLLQFFLDKE